MIHVFTMFPTSSHLSAYSVPTASSMVPHLHKSFHALVYQVYCRYVLLAQHHIKKAQAPTLPSDPTILIVPSPLIIIIIIIIKPHTFGPTPTSRD